MQAIPGRQQTVFFEANPLKFDLRPRSLHRAKISALGTYVPPRLLTNADLEKMVDTNDQWIVERTGIRTRHLVDPGVATSDIAVEAARVCLAERGIEPNELEAIIVATVTPDMLFPSTACLVQNKLGAQNVWGFDVSAACSAFVYALQVGAKLIESGAHKKVMVIGADVMSSIIDYKDRATCIIFGDGAGAVLLEPAEEGEVGMIDYLAVYKFAVRKMSEATEALLVRNGIRGSDLDCFIPHQANKRIIESTAERLGITSERVIINIDRFGNTTAGTIPLAMQTAREENKLHKGDLVLLASVGAGYTVGTCLLRWEI
jgi:3-oxoacyl-[acyl-carrier-protein] synthase III